MLGRRLMRTRHGHEARKARALACLFLAPDSYLHQRRGSSAAAVKKALRRHGLDDAVDTWVLSWEGKAAEKPDPGPIRALRGRYSDPMARRGRPKLASTASCERRPTSGFYQSGSWRLAHKDWDDDCFATACCEMHCGRITWKRNRCSDFHLQVGHAGSRPPTGGHSPNAPPDTYPLHTEHAPWLSIQSEFHCRPTRFETPSRGPIAQAVSTEAHNVERNRGRR